MSRVGHGSPLRKLNGTRAERTIMLRRVFAVVQRAALASLIVAAMPERTRAQSPATRPIAARSAAINDDGEWRMATKDYANARYSSLDQINTSNAKDLKVSWTLSTGIDRGHEAAPLIVGDMMYIVTPHPN